jgi:extradiol dioxygenase family protein
MHLHEPQQRLAQDTRPQLAPFHLSTITHSLADARRFYGEILGCEEKRATGTSVHFDFCGSQLTLHEIKGYSAESVRRDVDAEDVPVPHFGAAIDEPAFHEIAGRLREAGWDFILEPHVRFADKNHEQWVLFVLDPSGNAIEIKSFTKAPPNTWM